jgi:hypothetical protein
VAVPAPVALLVLALSNARVASDVGGSQFGHISEEDSRNGINGL